MPPESLGADWQMWQVAAQARMVLELDAGVPLGFFLNRGGAARELSRRRRWARQRSFRGDVVRPWIPSECRAPSLQRGNQQGAYTGE